MEKLFATPMQKMGLKMGLFFQAAAMFIFHRESDDSAKDLGYMGVS